MRIDVHQRAIYRLHGGGSDVTTVYSRPAVQLHTVSCCCRLNACLKAKQAKEVLHIRPGALHRSLPFAGAKNFTFSSNVDPQCHVVPHYLSPPFDQRTTKTIQKMTETIVAKAATKRGPRATTAIGKTKHHRRQGRGSKRKRMATRHPRKRKRCDRKLRLVGLARTVQKPKTD